MRITISTPFRVTIFCSPTNSTSSTTRPIATSCTGRKTSITGDDRNSAVVVDAKCTKDGWATGAIGFPSVLRVDDETLLLVYDAIKGNSIGHTPRHIGYGYWKIPKFDETGKPVSAVLNK